MLRLKAIDGLRTIAVLGVLWAHIWMFMGTPAFSVANINLASFISFFGTGVDLFFVISGFCMYLMYINRNQAFTPGYYISYLKKRWLRIAPAFYVAIIVYALVQARFMLLLIDPVYMLKHALFIRNLFEEATQYAPHFWSLCTEWHFYLVLPFIVWGVQKFGFYPALIFVVAVCLLFRTIIWVNNDDAYNIINYSIPNRLIEFAMGIIAAKIYLDKQMEWIFSSIVGLLTGVAIAFTGRLLMTAGMQDRSDLLGMMSRTWNLPLLSAGYAIVMINVLQHKTLFSRFLETSLMTSIGKYSYSMYLWHWIIAESLTKWVKAEIDLSGFWMVNLIFILSVVILFPLSKLSYVLFESFYFKKRKPVQASAS